MMQQLSDILNPSEEAFVRQVIRTPGDKIEVAGSAWLRPETLGLVKRIGLGKWVPTDKIKIQIGVEL